jgi:hypothetical protein
VTIPRRSRGFQRSLPQSGFARISRSLVAACGRRCVVHGIRRGFSRSRVETGTAQHLAESFRRVIDLLSAAFGQRANMVQDASGCDGPAWKRCQLELPFLRDVISVEMLRLDEPVQTLLPHRWRCRRHDEPQQRDSFQPTTRSCTGCLHVFEMIGILAMPSGVGTTASKLRGTGENAYSTLKQKHLPGRCGVGLWPG